MNNKDIAAEAAKEFWQRNDNWTEQDLADAFLAAIEKALAEPQWIGEPTAAELERHQSRVAQASENLTTTKKEVEQK